MKKKEVYKETKMKGMYIFHDKPIQGLHIRIVNRRGKIYIELAGPKGRQKGKRLK